MQSVQLAAVQHNELKAGAWYVSKKAAARQDEQRLALTACNAELSTWKQVRTFTPFQCRPSSSPPIVQ